MVPEDYHTYLDVFSKERADTLPPHRPFDHTIEVPGAYSSTSFDTAGAGATNITARRKDTIQWW